MKRLWTEQSVDEVSNPPQHASSSLDDLPRSVVCTLWQGSTIMSMDFHPSHHTLLAVGCSNGKVTLWEIRLQESLVSKPFKVWNMAACCVAFQEAIVKDSSVSINRVAWSPDGNLIGVAFTKYLVHLYAYQGPNDLRQQLEIDAHSGGVNDLGFFHQNKQLCIATCGDDKLIKVWDLDGRKLFRIEGHEAPVYSICPYQKENIQFMFSTAVDGKIKAWQYDNMAASCVDCDAPGKWYTTMLHSDDGNRLFSCGTSKDGDSFLVEWNESEGGIKRTYSGFGKKSCGIAQFDATKNQFLAVGEDSQIKFWDMDSTNILFSIDADGGLPPVPRLKFNKEGNLLVVTTADNGFKVLANADGLRSLRAFENRSYTASKRPIEMKLLKGTTIMAMLVHDGVVLVSDSKSKSLSTSEFFFRASKVTEITPSIYTAGAGIAFKTVTASRMLQKHIREDKVHTMAETPIEYAAERASGYLCDLTDLTDFPEEIESYLLVAGYYNRPYAYLAWDRERGMVEPIDSFRVVGCGARFAEEQLRRDGLSELQIDLSVGQAIPYIKRAFYRAYLKDALTGGVCSGYYIHSGGSELILQEWFDDMHIDLTPI